MQVNFDLVWSVYPRKVAKAAARKAWNKINPSPELANIIFSAIRNWMDTEQWKDQRYIPHLATFLNGERWEDELPVKEHSSVLDLTKK